MEYYIIDKKENDASKMVITCLTDGTKNEVGNQVLTITNDAAMFSKGNVKKEDDEIDENGASGNNDVLQKDFELVEVTDTAGHSSVVIQEPGIALATEVVQEGDKNYIEQQYVEIPEDAEQCQIILYPDGTFKLLNILDPSKS